MSVAEDPHDVPPEERLRRAYVERDAARHAIERTERADALAHRLRSSTREGSWAHRLAWGVLAVKRELARVALEEAEAEVTYAIAACDGIDIGERTRP